MLPALPFFTRLHWVQSWGLNQPALQQLES
jgi:hypothetical protein